MIPDELIGNLGDCHIYLNQIDPIQEQLNNKSYKLPELKLSNNSIFDIKIEEISIIGYKSSKRVNYKLSN